MLVIEPARGGAVIRDDSSLLHPIGSVRVCTDSEDHRQPGLVALLETIHPKRRPQAPPDHVLGRGHGFSHCPLERRRRVRARSARSLPGGAWTSPFQAQRSKKGH
jgi:hypothetical protein